MAEQKYRVVYYLFGICVYGRREFSAMNLKHLLFKGINGAIYECN